MPRRARPAVLLIVLLLAAWYGLSQSAYGRALSLLVRMGGVQGRVAAHVGTWQTTDVETRMLALSGRHGARTARLYLPARVRTRTVLLTGGVHALGIDEPRFVAFARALAASGTPVVTPALPDLREYLVTGRLTDDIEDAARAVLASADVPAGDGRIGMLGISFAGGLSIIAAGRPALRDHVAFVLSVGGHADLPGVLRYLCTGVQPDGRHHPPHDYGGVILLMNLADRVVPPAQVVPLRQAIARFLHASHVDMFDKARAAAEFAEAREAELALPPEARALMHLVNTRDVPALGARLLTALGDFGRDPHLSPVRSPAPRAPVSLLHAAGDTVIPDSEAPALAAYLTAQGTPNRLLVTSIMSHAEVARPPTPGELWTLVRFWAEMEW